MRRGSMMVPLLGLAGALFAASDAYAEAAEEGEGDDEVDAAEAPPASAPPAPPPEPSEVEAKADSSAGIPIALGLSGGVVRRNDYGDRTRSAFVPEIVGFSYFGAGRVHLRPGLRMGFARFGGADVPGALRFKERDTTLTGEVGLLFDGVLIPTLTAGGGVRLRSLALTLGRSIEAETEPISGWEALPTAYVQASLGMPVSEAPLVIEPFARFEHIAGDDRSRWRFGLDITIELPN